MEPPRCFVSYSWDSEKHREWVRILATRLIESGIDTILDQFDCAPGMDLTKFMEKSVRESNFVLLVCTPNFAHKADSGVGGVGYEKAIVTGEIFSGEVRETKFIPLVREGDTKESLPSYLRSKLFIDFREDAFFEDRLKELLRHFYGEPLYPKPTIGRKPDFQNLTISEPVSKPTVTKPVKKAAVTKPIKKTSLQPTFKNSISMEFILISAGSSMIGSKFSPEELSRKYGREVNYYQSEHPRHKVLINKPFYIQNTQVTQSQWQKIMRNNPSRFKTFGDDCPVEQVSWDDAQKFIDRLNGMEKTDEYRLPSEAEWEYSCRAGTTTEFSFGDEASELGDYAWCLENSEKRTHAVGTKKPNAWGLYDMHGNVWEWLEDDYHLNYDGAPPDSGAWVDKPRNSFRVMRGGSFLDGGRACRSSCREGRLSDFSFFRLGFRLALSTTTGP